MNPKRIQRKRVQGWKMPENTVSITRPGKWGNPFKVEEYGLSGSIALFEQCLETPHMIFTHMDEIQCGIEYERLKWMKNNIHLLKGKNLACFCKEGKPCHGDVLLEIANK